MAARPGGGGMAEVGVESVSGPTTMWTDNAGTLAVGSNTGSMGRSRHLARRAHFLTELHAREEMRLRYLPGSAMPADFLTKPLPKILFVKHRDYVMGTAAQPGWQGAGERRRTSSSTCRRDSLDTRCLGEISAGNEEAIEHAERAEYRQDDDTQHGGL